MVKPNVLALAPKRECKRDAKESKNDTRENGSMARRSRTRKRKVADVVQRMDVGQKDASALKSKGFTTLLEGVMQEILTVTYWFDPAPHPLPSPVTIRFSGHRVDAKGWL